MIVNAIVQDKDALVEYTSQAVPLFKEAGGISTHKFQILDTIVGNNETKMIAVMEFPNSENIKSVFDSEAYKALIPIRTKAFSSLNVFIGNE